MPRWFVGLAPRSRSRSVGSRAERMRRRGTKPAPGHAPDTADMQPLGCGKSRSVARLSLRLPSAYRLLEVPTEGVLCDERRWIHEPPTYSNEPGCDPPRNLRAPRPWPKAHPFPPDPVPWWRWWLR